MNTKISLGLIFLSLSVMGGSIVCADAPATLVINTQKLGPKIADDFVGLSYETKREMPDDLGKYYFRPDNSPLIKMFQTLEIKNLRIGGNTVDSAKVAIPVQADIDDLFAFASSANTKVIYSFRLHNGDPPASALQAKYISDHFSGNLLCFSIGNEPDLYVHGCRGYLKIWEPIYDAINQAVPGAKYCGPSLTSNGVHWAHEFAEQVFPGGKILYITQHEYAGGAGGKIKDPVFGRDLMLSPDWPQKYQKYYGEFVPPLQAVGAPFRLEETNNFYNGGAVDVSDSFASALWGVDYLYWWAAHGSQGINFHNGDEVAAGQTLRPCWYASFTSVPDGYMAHPLAYGIKMFNLGARGQIVSANLTPDDSAKDLNMTAYAVLGSDKNLYVTLINKEHGTNARDAMVTIQTGAVAYSGAQSMALIAPGGDIAAKDGLKLGGAPISDDGSWQGTWTELRSTQAGGQLQVEVPASSILLVKLKSS